MWLIRFIAIYLPFEEFILKWLPVTDRTYALLRQFPDFALLFLAVLLLLHRVSTGKAIPLIGGVADWIFVLFFSWSLATIIFNPEADLFIEFANIKALLRYVLLIYIVLMINPSQLEIERLFKWLTYAIIAQIIVSVIQFVGGISVRDFFAARHVDEGVGGIRKMFTGDRFSERNDLVGTMGDTISFGYFMLLGLVLLLFGANGKKIKLLASTLLVVLIFYSGSKAIFIVSLAFCAGYFVRRYGWLKFTSYSILLLPAILLGLYLSLSSEYLSAASVAFERLMEGMMNSRLGIIVYLIPDVFFTANGLFGFGADRFSFTEYVISTMPATPSVLISVLPKVLEDVYWAALYIYYGLIGLSLWSCFLLTIYARVGKLMKYQNFIDRRTSLIASSLLLVSIPLNFLNQAYEARSFSFYLWLFCALAILQNRKIIDRTLVGGA